MLNLSGQHAADSVWADKLKGEILNLIKEQEKERKLKNKQNKKSPVLLLRIHDQRSKTDERKHSQWKNKLLQALHKDQLKKQWNNQEIFMSFPPGQSTGGRGN